MSLEPESNGSQVLVTFRLPETVDAEKVYVVGEFNGWSEDADPMEREDGAFVARLALTPGRTYRFRYLLDGERWENDWAADAYVPNEFGGEDSVIDLTATATAEPDAESQADPPPVKPKAKRTTSRATAKERG
jgi:1,4-alpha-glucan branching enzyme